MAEQSDEITEIWSRAVQLLSESPHISGQQLGFVRLTRPLGLLDGTALLAVPNDFTKDFLESRARGPLTIALTEAAQREIRFAVTVDPSLESAIDGARTFEDATGDDELRDGRGDEAAFPSGTPAQSLSYGSQYEAAPYDRGLQGAPSGSPAATQPFGSRDSYGDVFRSDSRQDTYQDQRDSRPDSRLDPPALPPDTSRLNPKYIFETFVIGSSNRFAHAAALAVSEAPAKTYNPLFIYGGSGLGKTHLLHAIGHYAASLYPGIRVRYVNSEEFTNEFINSIRDDRAGAFQRRYRDVDVLLIDDIQFLQGKEQTMEEFFHTFNALHNSNKQVVITSDLPPKLLAGFEDRMRSRFEWGLITDVQPPDLETRIAILRKKAASENLDAPDDVLSYIASRIATNIRELEGALIRVTAFANLNRQAVDLSLAEIVLKDLITDDGAAEITPAMIIGQTASYFGLTIDDLCGASRSRVLVTARQIAMYLCRELTDMSLPKIGAQFGGRDHTTVMHANKKIRELMTERRAIYNQVTELTNRIKQQQRG